ncbi:MAG TPA: DUF4382 domain-containing protein [Nitrososphaerales archaeon]|nr:DUF4382 domain-containing protein [Nitrososphaerales archaeon]
MNSNKKSALVSGTIAALIAVAVIGIALGTGVLGSATTRGSTLFSTTNSGSSGTLAVLMTDPPTVPNGVTAVYITYANMAVHVTGAGNQSGWHSLGTNGTINLMSVINATQTIASAKIDSGNFNAIGFNITSAIVTYNGQNYTADLVYGHNMLVVPIVGGIRVDGGATAATMIDMTPTVLKLESNDTSSATTSFAFIPSAKAYTIPAQSTSSLHLRVGERDDIHDAPWWIAIEHGSHFEITSAKLSGTTLSITVTNTGNASLVFRTATVTSSTSQSGGYEGGRAVFADGSALFVVEPNGTMIQASSALGEKGMVSAVIAGGYLLSPGQSATFTYTGASITLGLTQHMQLSSTGITSGQKYIVSLFGNGMIAQTAVTAS